MNKKFLCGILGCVMAFGSVFPLAGCKDKDPEGQGGGKDDTVIEPGTVITDEEIKTNIYKALSETELGGFTYSASANLSVTAGESAKTQKIVAEGALVLEDSKVQADVFSYVTGADGEDEVTQYMLLFVRGSHVYTASGDNTEGKVDFSEIKSALKAEKDPIVLDRSEISGDFSSALKMPVAVKMMKNLPSLFEGVITKTEGGFSLEYDAVGAVKNILSGVSSLAGAIEKDIEITLGELFGQDFIKTTLGKLLNGITSKELVDALENFLPKKVASALPAAEKDETAVAYVEGLLRSGTFYEALTGGDEAFGEWKTFSEVPLSKLIGILTGEEFTFEGMELTDMVEKLRDDLEAKLVSLLLGLVELDEGELSGEDIDLSIGFEFDNDKKLLGFSIDGLATGIKTTESGEEQDAVKTTARATVKIEAAVVSAPELFDLAGVSYFSEQGGKAKIRAAK